MRPQQAAAYRRGGDARPLSRVPVRSVSAPTEAGPRSAYEITRPRRSTRATAPLTHRDSSWLAHAATCTWSLSGTMEEPKVLRIYLLFADVKTDRGRFGRFFRRGDREGHGHPTVDMRGVGIRIRKQAEKGIASGG